MIQKNTRIEMPKLLKACKGEPCAKCGRQDETVIPAHYSGLYSDRLGKGFGVKAHDICACPLCVDCHAIMDSYAEGNDAERAAEFMVMILETLARRVREGVIK